MSDPAFNITNQLYRDIFAITNVPNGSLTVTAFIDLIQRNSTITAPVTAVNKMNEVSGYISKEEYLYYTHIFAWIKAIGQPLSVFLMIISARVFMSRGMRNSSTGLLVTLNIAEAYNVSLLFIYQICKLTKSCSDVHAYVVFLLYSSGFLGTACRRSVYIFNCLVALQRFFVVAFPLRSKDWTILHRPKTTSAAVILLMLLFHVYVPIKYDVKHSGREYRSTLSQVAIDHPYIFSTISTANICITSYLPSLVGLFANIGMGASLYIHSKSMRFTTDTSDRQLKRFKKNYQTTVIVLTSTLLFFIFALPSTLNYVVMETSSNYGLKSKERYLYLTLNSGFVLCQTVSDVVVFFSYVYTGSTFRQHLVAMFVGRFRTKDTDSTTPDLENDVNDNHNQ